MPVNSKLSITLDAKITGTVDKGNKSAQQTIQALKSFLDGTGAGQNDRAYVDDFSVTTSPTDLDLAGALLDAIGGPFVLARVKGLVIVCDGSPNVNNLVVGAAAANPWIGFLGATHTMTLRPGAAVALSAGQTDATGYAVVAGTGDLLRLVASAGTVTGTIGIVGCSA